MHEANTPFIRLAKRDTMSRGKMWAIRAAAFVVAILLAVLLDPISTRLRKRLRFPRALAAMTTLVGMIAVVVGLLVLAGRSILIGFTDLADQAVQGFNELLSWLADGPL